MKPQYKDQLTEWRPDYPMLWNSINNDQVFDVYGMGMSTFNRRKNIRAFKRATNAIIKAMKGSWK